MGELLSFKLKVASDWNDKLVTDMKSEDSKLDEELMYHRVGKCSPLSRDCFCSSFFSLFTCEHEFLNPILGKSFIPYRTDRSASEDDSVSVDPPLLTGLRKESPKGESFGTSGISINGQRQDRCNWALPVGKKAGWTGLSVDRWL